METTRCKNLTGTGTHEPTPSAYQDEDGVKLIICSTCGRRLAETPVEVNEWLSRPISFMRPCVSVDALEALGWENVQRDGSTLMAETRHEIQLVITDEMIQLYHASDDEEAHLGFDEWGDVRTPQQAEEWLSEYRSDLADFTAHEGLGVRLSRRDPLDRCFACGCDDKDQRVSYDEQTFCLACGHSFDSEEYVDPDILAESIPWQHLVMMELRAAGWESIEGDEEELLVIATRERPSTGSEISICVGYNEVIVGDVQTGTSQEYTRIEWMEIVEDGPEYSPDLVEEVLDLLIADRTYELIGRCVICSQPVDVLFNDVTVLPYASATAACTRCGCEITLPLTAINTTYAPDPEEAIRRLEEVAGPKS